MLYVCKTFVWQVFMFLSNSETQNFNKNVFSTSFLSAINPNCQTNFIENEKFFILSY